MEENVWNEFSENKTQKGKRGATRHCCYGLCRSDSRYQDRDHMKNITWIKFPKPHRDRERCEKWVHACGRVNFTVKNVNKWTYICSKHFVGGNGPTPDSPDPIPASFTPVQVSIYLFIYFFVVVGGVSYQDYPTHHHNLTKCQNAEGRVT